MAIRRGISDPDGRDTKAFSRALVHGPLPKTPDKKPSAAEREPLLAVLETIPIGKQIALHDWTYKWSLPFIQMKFRLWDIEFAIYPVGRPEYNNCTTCTKVMVRAITRNRRGQQPTLFLEGKYSRAWYREILDWIDDHWYGG